MATWIEDENKNRASVEYWGTEEKAREALATLEKCERCENCSRCYGCYDFSDCSRCSRCSRCSGCSGCSRCSHIAFLCDKEGVQVDGESGEVKLDVGVPPVPRIENIHQRIYEAVSKPDALKMDNWHACETTHCRAGWVVHLAGPAGYALEKFHNTELAAMLIYRESGYYINPARFYDPADAALADMKKLAEATA